MRYEHPETPDIIIDRAVDLWCRALVRPKFDNGATEFPSVMAGGMARDLFNAEAAKVDDYDAAIERFREVLTTALKFARDNNGKSMSAEHAQQYLAAHPHMAQYYSAEKPPSYHFERHLNVDYHPCLILAEAATAAGLPHSAFSWKSSVDIGYEGDHVRTSFGYGAGDDYHYPLPDGGWLITKLHGQAMPTIIAAVAEGRLPELTVEAAA